MSLLAIAALVATVVIARAGRGLTFHFDDEWLMITQRRDVSLDDLLRPHSSHLVAVPVLIYAALLRIVGLRSYVPYLGVLVALHLVVCGLLFASLRRRTSVWYAAGSAVLLLFLGTAWQNLLWAFTMQYLVSLATGLAALLLLDRRTRGADIAALVALVASLASSGMGLVFVLGAVVELAWSGERRRLWVPLGPAALWLAWYLTRSSSRGTADNLVHAPGYMVDQTGAAFAGLAGSSQTVGVVVAGAVVAVVVVSVVRAWPIDSRFAASIAMAFGLALLLAYGRDPRVPPTESRYVYLGAVVFMLLGAEVIRTWSPSRIPVAARIAGTVVVVGVLAHSVWVNTERLDEGGRVLRFAAEQYRIGWSALVRSGPGVDRQADVAILPESDLPAGAVLDAVRDLDFPLLTREELFELAPDERTGADFQVAFAAGLRDREPNLRGAGGVLPIVSPADLAPDARGCVVAAAGDGPAQLVLGGDGISATVDPTDPVEVRVRAIADDFTPWPFTTFRPGRGRPLRLAPIDLAPWSVELRSERSFRVCPAR